MCNGCCRSSYPYPCVRTNSLVPRPVSRWLSLVDDARAEAHGEILPQADGEVALALRSEQRVKCAHLAAIICTPANRVIGACEQLAVGGMSVLGCEEQWFCAGQRFLDALEATRRNRVDGEIAESHAADLQAVRNQARGFGVIGSRRGRWREDGSAGFAYPLVGGVRCSDDFAH